MIKNSSLFLFSLLLSLVGALFLYPLPARAEFETLYPGVKTLGIWLPAEQVRLNINVWYPSIRKPSVVNYNPWKILASRNGKEVPGRFPLLLLSHDSPGGRFSHHSLAAFLAQSGFVVVAPTHHGDNTNNMQNLFTLKQLLQRVDQMKATLETVLQHPETMHSIDPDRIGIMGFGTGATTALLMGGALPNSAGWANYCTQAGSADTYCTAWAVARLNKLMRSLPLKASLADQRIKAVAAVAPAYGMLFDKESMRYFYPPLLIIRADEDDINRAPLHADALRQLLNTPPKFASIQKADAASLMASCPPAFQRDLPELCNSVSLEDRLNIHSTLENQLGDFFLSTLGDSHNLPIIPPPPNLTPAPIKPKPPLDLPIEKKKGRRSGKTTP